MYLILKPEARENIDTIEEIVLQEGFDIALRYHIGDWTSLASKLYLPQINGDAIFAGEFESCLWLTNHFFGNNAAALTLEKNGELKENLRLLNTLKSRIRKEINREDNNFRIFINLDRVYHRRKYPIGTVGRLGIESHGAIKLEKDGRWDCFYFKYIHVPDPDIKNYEREQNVLKKEGVLNSPIPCDKWRLMKQMRTLVYPSGNLK